MGSEMCIRDRPSAHLPCLATRAGLGTISRSSDVARFVQGGVVKTFRCATYRVTFVDPQRIQTRDELIAFISDIVRDHKFNGLQWENGDVRSFLEAMASWLEDCDGYYGDQRDVGVADWQIFADALAAARIYE